MNLIFLQLCEGGKNHKTSPLAVKRTQTVAPLSAATRTQKDGKGFLHRRLFEAQLSYWPHC